MTTTRFPAERARIRDLRRWAETALPLLGFDGRQQAGVCDAVELVLTELGANAILHGCGGERSDVQLTAFLRYGTSGLLRVAVADPGSSRPEYRPPSADATCGRGLALVMGVVARFGVDDLPEGGKVVWGEIEVPASVRAVAAVDKQAGGRDVVPLSASVARTSRSRRAVGQLPGRPMLGRIPAA
ncbi:ATP-binding protein [Streptomyces sp. CBMA156]|uniref:ATP-binding protein n=1 Tax=Streptomyces sp. CBMA156 TaxID=1930280 RepID=UPI001661E34A|nr:ATP-binding protein [Streptomyces sp. CBMA156]MBD0670072.1 hypothetical protein [Streptomyces sp. CBMA156]